MTGAAETAVMRIEFLAEDARQGHQHGRPTSPCRRVIELRDTTVELISKRLVEVLWHLV
jgi:hypothetical protein